LLNFKVRLLSVLVYTSVAQPEMASKWRTNLSSRVHATG